MKNNFLRFAGLAGPAVCLITLLAVNVPAWAEAPAKRSFAAPNGMTVSVEMIGPVTQTTELQIICVLKHDAAGGDKYIEAMDDFNTKLGRILSNLRERGEFVGEVGETLVFDPPAGTITPKRVLLIGVGPETKLTVEILRLAGRIAVREAVRLKAANVAFAPTLRDQGSSRIDVADGDRAVAEGVIEAYATEKSLQAEKLAAPFEVASFTIEAGPKYFEAASEKVGEGVKQMAQAATTRPSEPYRQTKAVER